MWFGYEHPGSDWGSRCADAGFDELPEEPPDDESEDENAAPRMSPTHLRGSDLLGVEDPTESTSEPLRLHDWMRRERLMQDGKAAVATPMDGTIRLPSSYKKEGIVHLPEWTKVGPRAVSDRNPAHFPPRRRHDDSVYAMLCDKLMKQLAGKARSRIRYEFFYSDLDKQW